MNIRCVLAVYQKTHLAIFGVAALDLAGWHATDSSACMLGADVMDRAGRGSSSTLHQAVGIIWCLGCPLQLSADCNTPWARLGWWE